MIRITETGRIEGRKRVSITRQQIVDRDQDQSEAHPKRPPRRQPEQQRPRHHRPCSHGRKKNGKWEFAGVANGRQGRGLTKQLNNRTNHIAKGLVGFAMGSKTIGNHGSVHTRTAHIKAKVQRRQNVIARECFAALEWRRHGDWPSRYLVGIRTNQQRDRLLSIQPCRCPQPRTPRIRFQDLTAGNSTA